MAKQRVLADSYLSSFCLELSMLLQSGITPEDSIMILRDDERDNGGRAVLEKLYDIAKTGEPLSAVFRTSGYFPNYLMSMTEFGERTGNLAETMKALSEYYHRQDRLAVTLRGAIIYPSMLLMMMVAAVLILIIQVLPIFNDVFGRMGAQMSPLAVNLMHFGGWLSGASAVIAAVVCAIAVLAVLAWAVPSVRDWIGDEFNNFWGGRGIFAKIAAVRFMSVLAVAVRSGLDFTEAVNMASAISGGAKAVDEKNVVCVNSLNSGKTLPEALSDSGIISARDSRMLSVGSKSGHMDDAIEEIAKRKDLSLQDDITRTVSRIEPTLVIITSIIVGIVLFSVMLPLIGIMSSIG